MECNGALLPTSGRLEGGPLGSVDRLVGVQPPPAIGPARKNCDPANSKTSCQKIEKSKKVHDAPSWSPFLTDRRPVCFLLYFFSMSITLGRTRSLKVIGAMVGVAAVMACAVIIGLLVMGGKPDTLGGGTMQIAFAADFATGTGCTSAKDAIGCDLYGAIVTSAGDVRSVTRLTNTVAAESFPSWHPGGEVVYFNSQGSGSNTYEPPNIEYFVVGTGESGTLIPYASHPSVMPSGNALMYSALPKHILTQSILSATRTKITNTDVLVAGEDRFEPMVSGDGNLVVFHETSDTNAGASIYNIHTEEMVNISLGDGTGHCAINGGSTLAVCDQKTGGGLTGVAIVSGEIGASTLVLADPKMAVIRALDQDYDDCDLASVNFPTFFDDATLLVTISCHQRGADGFSNAVFSKLFLAQLQTQTFIPIGERLAEAYDGVGRDSYTADVQ